MSRPVNKEILKTLVKIAEANPSENAKVAAAIVFRNKIVSIGINSRKTHPMQARFGKNADSIHLHAEISAIRNALRECDAEELSKMEMYVVRVKKPRPFAKKFEWGLAKPCIGCQRAIEEFGLKRVIYTTNENGIYGEM